MTAGPESCSDLEELWRQVEAAGPLSASESLSDPRPGVDPDSWAERALTQADRRRSFIARYAWAVPTREAVDAIRLFLSDRRLLEVCAGSGLWAALLTAAGAAVVANDAVPAQHGYTAVEMLEAERAVRAHPESSALLLCWPPFRNDCAARALNAFQGDTLITVGDIRFTADDRLWALVERDWELRDRIALPSWPGLDDQVRLYRRPPPPTIRSRS